jgi:hypothetical protein
MTLCEYQLDCLFFFSRRREEVVTVVTSSLLTSRSRHSPRQSGTYNPLSEEWEVENVCVSPDVEVEQDPALVRTGRGPQLEKAVEVVLEELKKNLAPALKRPAYATAAAPLMLRMPVSAHDGDDPFAGGRSYERLIYDKMVKTLGTR